MVILVDRNPSDTSNQNLTTKTAAGILLILQADGKVKIIMDSLF